MPRIASLLGLRRVVLGERSRGQRHQRYMSTVKCLLYDVQCTCFEHQITESPIDHVAIWKFGNRTKCITHRRTSHLTANTCDSPCIQPHPLAHEGSYGCPAQRT